MYIGIPYVCTYVHTYNFLRYIRIQLKYLQHLKLFYYYIIINYYYNLYYFFISLEIFL